jgi:hypothetical protein
VTPRFGAEFCFDRADGRLAVTAANIDGIKASQASYLTAWSGLIGIFGGAQNISSDVTPTTNAAPNS